MKLLFIYYLISSFCHYLGDKSSKMWDDSKSWDANIDVPIYYGFEIGYQLQKYDLYILCYLYV